MAINFKMEIDKVTDTLSAINSIGMTLSKPENFSAALKSAFKVTSSDFVVHMTGVAISNPRRMSHMYEWERVGDPNARLWKQMLKGNGKNRKVVFEFKASKTTVPVPEKLRRKRVKKIHIFYWKAPILEYGLPVVISRKAAKALVYLQNEKKKASSGSFVGFNSGGIVYRTSPVHIDRAGTPEQWGAFTEEYNDWWSSDKPNKSIEKNIGKKSNEIIKEVLESRLKQIDAKKSTVTMTPIGFDATVAQKLQTALNNNYAIAARNRVVGDG